MRAESELYLASLERIHNRNFKTQLCTMDDLHKLLSSKPQGPGADDFRNPTQVIAWTERYFHNTHHAFKIIHYLILAC